MERERQREKESITEKYNIVSENNNKIKTERTRRAGGGCKQFSPPSPRLWLWYNTYSTRTSLGRELRNRFSNYNRVT